MPAPRVVHREQKTLGAVKGLQKGKTSSIRGGTRFWGPIELAESTLNATKRLAISFFAFLQKKAGNSAFLRLPFLFAWRPPRIEHPG
jgi:hypothetical protein